MRQLLQREAHLEWFDSFFGPKTGTQFYLCPAVLNGPSNYGAHLTRRGGQDLYCMLGVWENDRDGRPFFDKSVLPTVIHEFTHSYVNPLIFRHEAELEAPCTRLYARCRVAMERQAYGNWRTMALESLVRACVIQYRAKYDGGLAGAAEMLDQHNRGFTWIGELSKALDEYRQQRDRYPALEPFMPRIIEAFKTGAGPATRPAADK